MKANLLLVSNDDFPVHFSDYLERHNFTCYQARGRLKLRETFVETAIDTIVWLFKDYDAGLADDLIRTFNEFSEVPLVLLTEEYGNTDLSESISGVFAHLDVNDELEDIRRVIESACNIALEPNPEIKHVKLPEIDFKNAVRHLLKAGPDTDSQPDDQSKLNLESPWLAVGKKEKKILAAGLIEKKQTPFQKILRSFQRDK